jgi:hypothetical protein
MCSLRKTGFAIAAASLLAITGVGCGPNNATSQGTPTTAATSTPSAVPSTTRPTTPSAVPSATGSASPSDRSTSAPHRATGPVWPIEPRTVRSLPAEPGDDPGPAVLRAIRAGEHGTYERLVLDFSAPYGSATVSYVPVVHADPSDKLVPLRGKSFMQITIQGAVATYVGVPITPYAGPTTVTPGYPTLKQVSVSGDFEAVLSLGVGLARTAGFRVMALRDPCRLVIDVAEPPAWRMWPETSLAAARAIQAAVDQGHQPWRGDPVEVAGLYAKTVYRLSDPAVARVGTGNTYRLSHRNSADSVLVQVVRPFGQGICEIGETR